MSYISVLRYCSGSSVLYNSNGYSNTDMDNAIDIIRTRFCPSCRQNMHCSVTKLVISTLNTKKKLQMPHTIEKICQSQSSDIP